MIFVTVGTTMPFDELFETVDNLKKKLFSEHEVICQIGTTSYMPKYCTYFRFESDLSRYFNEADFLIIHGGTGTTIEALTSQKPFIALANPRATHDHQGQFLLRVEKEYGIIWTRNCNEIEVLYHKSLSKRFYLNKTNLSLVNALLEIACK